MHDFATVFASARANIDNPIRHLNGFLVVLHHNQGVSEVSEFDQRVNQAPVISLVESDTWLVQNVQHTGQPGPNLGCQTDALGFATRERARRSSHTEVAQAHLEQKLQTRADFSKNRFCDSGIAFRERKAGHEGERVLQAHIGNIRNRCIVDGNRENVGPQALARAFPALDFSQIVGKTLF